MNRHRRLLSGLALLIVGGSTLIYTNRLGMGEEEGSFSGLPTEELEDWDHVKLVDEIWNVGTEDGSESEVIGQVAGVTFTQTGVAIADGYSSRIHWYDATGGHERSAGRVGDGPGEFRAVGSLGYLPDGTLVALDAGGSVELFSGPEEKPRRIGFPGSPIDLCVLDSTLVVLGTLSGEDRPLHRYVLPISEWSAVGTASLAPGPDSPLRRSMAYQLALGKIGCTPDGVVYAASRDGTVTAIGEDGAERWSVRIPSFVALVHESVGNAGIYNGPPAGALYTDWFVGVVPIGGVVAVQMERTHFGRPARGPGPPPSGRRTGGNPDLEVSIVTVFVDAKTGRILGKDDSLPRIMAAKGNLVAVERESPVPQVAVYSMVQR